MTDSLPQDEHGTTTLQGADAFTTERFALAGGKGPRAPSLAGNLSSPRPIAQPRHHGIAKVTGDRADGNSCPP